MSRIGLVCDAGRWEMLPAASDSPGRHEANDEPMWRLRHLGESAAADVVLNLDVFTEEGEAEAELAALGFPVVEELRTPPLHGSRGWSVAALDPEVNSTEEGTVEWQVRCALFNADERLLIRMWGASADLFALADATDQFDDLALTIRRVGEGGTGSSAS